jgi:hypothetical protein
MAIPTAPTNVWAQTGDNVAYLSWSLVATATSYQVQRSVDGVTFSNLGISVLPNYTDSSSQNNVAVDSTNLIVGFRYMITSLGTSTQADWTALGVPSSVAPSYGVTFVATATGSGTGSGQVQEYGNTYFYQVAALNGSGTGPYTSINPVGNTLSATPLPTGVTSLGSLRVQAQELSDMVNSQFVTLPEWNKYITQSYKELYDLLIAAYGNDYYVKTPYTYTTTGQIDPNYNAQVFPLPPDFYKLLLCEVALNPGDPNSWVTLRQYERTQQNLWNFPNVYTFYGITNLRYRLTGTQLQIVPIASAGQTIRIWYAPRPARLVSDTDLIDGISGWEQYILIDAAIKALQKEESDVSAFMGEKALLTARLEAMSQNRNEGEAQRVSDSRMRNFAWSDDGTMSGAGYW